MRIIGNIPHPRMKITVFEMNDKRSVKFELGGNEIILKNKQEDIQNWDKYQQNLMKDYARNIEDMLVSLAQIKGQLHEEEDFPPMEII